MGDVSSMAVAPGSMEADTSYTTMFSLRTRALHATLCKQPIARRRLPPSLPSRGPASGRPQDQPAPEHPSGSGSFQHPEASTHQVPEAKLQCKARLAVGGLYLFLGRDRAAPPSCTLPPSSKLLYEQRRLGQRRGNCGPTHVSVREGAGSPTKSLAAGWV